MSLVEQAGQLIRHGERIEFLGGDLLTRHVTGDDHDAVRCLAIGGALDTG